MRQNATMATVALSLWASLALGQPPKAAPPAAKPVTVTLAKPIDNLKLGDALQYFADKYGLKVTIDATGFAKKDGPVGDKTVRLAKVAAVPAAFVVEYLAQQVGGTSRKGGDGFVIEAGAPNDLPRLLSDPSPAMRTKAAQAVKITKDVENIPLREVLDYLSEKCDVSIFVDEVGFRRDKKVPNVLERVVRVPAQESALEKLADAVANMVGGRAVVRDEMILIVPALKSAS